ncbi:hypothetical protein GGQ84_001360 [Desulfitispora alkaliphila]|uniref:MBL fold metallo-hydrolase n=1 Tax=Desulfitispora alkaliphila TaxID=622674 RepID=UPI003D22B710
MNKKIYFVEEIIENQNEYMLRLLETSKETINAKTKFELYNVSKISSRLDFMEGNFISFKSEGVPIRANSDPIAKSEIYKNNIYRGNLIKKYKDRGKANDIWSESQVYSYHVNVGHGNCSIIVVKKDAGHEIWIVDCSEFDFTSRFNYRRNIVQCIDFIKNKFKINNFKVDKLLITHPHFDHINGIEYLADQNYLDGSEIWINFYYSWPGKYYNNLLSKLVSLNATFVEPKVSSITNNIEIIYPNKTILRVQPTKGRYSNFEIVPKNKVNNASVIYKVSFNGKSIIFPGDIEEEGWNNVTECEPFLKNATFYCISHHGSLTGHKRTSCPYGNTIHDIELCCFGKRINILMGRNGAYPGIYHPNVLNAFYQRLYTTDNFLHPEFDPVFLELNWQDECIVYYGTFEDTVQLEA